MIPADLIKKLKIKCGIPLDPTVAGTEFQPLTDDEFLSYLLDEASQTHSGRQFMDSLAEAPAVFLLTRKEIYTILAGAFAKSYDIGSKDGNLKKSQPFDHYSKLINQMDVAYQTLVRSGRTVKCTPVLLTDKVRYAYRNKLLSPDPVISLYLDTNTATEVTFRINQLNSIDITKVTFYTGIEPVYDFTESPPISETSTLLTSLAFTTNTYRVTKDINNPPNYLGILAENKYGRQYFLEQDITLPSTTP